jgi:hypothetical protein
MEYRTVESATPRVCGRFAGIDCCRDARVDQINTRAGSRQICFGECRSAFFVGMRADEACTGAEVKPAVRVGIDLRSRFSPTQSVSGLALP